MVRKPSILTFLTGMARSSGLDKQRSLVNCFDAVSLLLGQLFQTIVMKFVLERLPDVFHSCSGFCDGAKGVNCVFCEFELSRAI